MEIDMAGKYYAVKEGRNIGVFGTWDECKAQVDGYSGAIYKSFKTLDEAKAFLEMNPSQTALNAIGCKEFRPYFNGTDSLENCVENLNRETRRYAKRQLTWFKRNSKINWFYADEMSPQELLYEVDKAVINYLGGD